MSDEMIYSSYRAFLNSKYQSLKASKPSFSARFFARKAEIASTSYFRMVVKGERKLSPEYAQKFAKGLSLSATETKLLLKMVTLEQTEDPSSREKLLKEIQKLVRINRTSAHTMNASHVEVLSDLINLKLYLLPQSKKFKIDPHWIEKRFQGQLSLKEVEERISLLLKVGLWKIQDGKIQTLAPVLRTGNCLEESYLAETHVRLLQAAQKSIRSQPHQNRILGGRTFLFDKGRMAEVSKKIEEFKSELEAEFEDLNSENVYELHISFFEL